MSNELNVHQLIENPAIRQKLSFFVQKNTLFSIHSRKTTPHEKTRESIATGLIETGIKTDLSKAELEVWLVEPTKK